MRMHIQLPDELVGELDARLGQRQRSAFLAALVRRALDDERRWDELEAAIGSIDDHDHDWDADPAEWVRSQRSDVRRAG
jgi:metal-responsive CopG/Arc/MetJ family transcriptional regulator